MSIKYSDCSEGYKYGPDGHQLNNWDPDKDYGNEYVQVHFRIETKGYGAPSFIFTPEDRAAFDADLVEVFTKLGWECKEKAYKGSTATWIHGKSHLYLHPQDFSGEVLKNEIKTVAEALEKNKSFCLRWVDLYKTVYEMTDEEYKLILEAKREEITRDLLEAGKTKRHYLYHDKGALVNNIAARFGIPRIDDINKLSYFRFMNPVLTDYIGNILHSLIEKGYMVSPNSPDDHLVRTINKTEQKKKKLYIKED